MAMNFRKIGKIFVSASLAAFLLCSCGLSNVDKESIMRYKNFTYTESKTDNVTKSAACSFTDNEIKDQIVAGRNIVEDIYAAAADLSVSTFTIPAGNYGFKQNITVNSVNSAFYLHDIERPDDNPLTIICEGVTFWIQPTGLACANTSRAFHIRNCSNITFVGLTIDEYSPTDFEGIVSQIDYENNRIAITLNDNSMAATKTNISRAIAGSQSRIIPYKANGDLIASYYRIDTSWGPGALWVENFEATGNENEYWLYFKSDLLLKTNNNPSWIKTYGTEGIIEIGDVISYLYGNMLITLDNSKQITMDGLTSKLSKGMPSENGGYGNHTWRNCRFGPDEGTGKYICASEYMLNATRHGTTIDNCTLLGSSDDQINIHGYFGEITAVSGDNITVSNCMIGILEGDPIELYDNKGTLVTTLTVAKTPEDKCAYNGFLTVPIKVSGEIPSNYKDLTVVYPTMSCDGWTIKNCTFKNNYQRLLIQTGSGTFENNKIILMGDNVALESSIDGYMEGTFMGDMTFKDNVFVTSAIGMAFSCFSISQSPEWKGVRKTGTITIENNAFVDCGNFLNATNVENLIVKDNIFVEPKVVYKIFDEFDDLLGKIENVTNQEFTNNLLLSSAVDKENNNQKKISTEDAEKARLYARYSEYDAKTIVGDLWENLK